MVSAESAVRVVRDAPTPPRDSHIESNAQEGWTYSLPPAYKHRL